MEQAAPPVSVDEHQGFSLSKPLLHLLWWPHLTDLLMIEQTRGYTRVLSAESQHMHKLESDLNPKFAPAQLALVDVNEEQMMNISLN